MATMIRIGETLKNLRQSKGLSLRKLAKEIDVSHAVITLYEKNERYPTIDVVVRICKFFEVPFEYLVLGEKTSNKYKDLKLAELSSQVDGMDKEYRDMVKNYMKRVVSHGAERESLSRESKENPIIRKKPGKKNREK